ncbi:hypothetical protein [Jeotgalibacillus terrae]|uniref:Uncharacterized protein n=1 Tax=Jeotgalibacillus terrae TaxID=587735 RepID=A0ABW5ZGQ9_9BACL|nr:hypothetical protein [Jeotgalibacillus terrae]MBM7578550.1 hypothetical protein [Jeotgalibacillus terrae]
MYGSIKKMKHKRKMKKVKAGDGHLLKKYRLWNVFTHSLFHVEVTNKTEGETTKYAIKSKYFTEEPRVDLYKEGRHVSYSKLPAVLPVNGGVIKVNKNSIGINGIRYVSDQEATYSVYPDRRSVRGLRLWFHKRFPNTSALVGLIAVIALLISTTLGLVQLMESFSDIPWIAENIGIFKSPVTLSVGTNLTIGLAAALAGIERTLMFRNHWLIDIENINTGEG